MKKVFVLLAIVAVIPIRLASQNNKVLVETFTEMDCIMCPSTLEHIHDVYKADPGHMVILGYQTALLNQNSLWWQDTAELNWRYYRYYPDLNPGVPRGKLDGVRMGYNIITNWSQEEIDSMKAIPRNFYITPVHQLSPHCDSIRVKLKIHSNATCLYQAGKLRARVAVIEDSVVFPFPPGSNNEKVFRFLLRKFVPDTNGIVLKNSWTAGENDSVEFTAPLPDYIYDLNKVSLVAFIQYDSNKRVIQADVSPSVKRADYLRIDPVHSLNFSKISCTDTLKNVAVAVVNEGTMNLTAFDMWYSMDNDPPQKIHFTDNMLPGQTKLFYLPDLADTSGNHTLTVYVNNPNGDSISALFNRFILSVSANFVINKIAQSPYIYQNFSGNPFPPENWVINNLQHTTHRWQKNYDPYVNPCAFLKIHECMPQGISNELILPIINTIGMSKLSLAFDVSNAYGELTLEHKYDTMVVVVSANCGSTWDTVYYKIGPQLAVKEATAYPFFPTQASDWRRDTIVLDNYINHDQLMIKYIATSGGGNNLFVTNINLGEYLGTDEWFPDADVFPNPATGSFRVGFKKVMKSVDLILFNSGGTAVSSYSFSSIRNANINTCGLKPGFYILNIQSEGYCVNKKILILR